MIFLRQRVSKLISNLGELRYPDTRPIENYKVIKTKERFSDIVNLDVSNWKTHHFEELWGGHREYFWFEATITIPHEFHGKPVEFKLITGREGEWDAVNPQFSLYLDGRLRQGMDVNHTTALLSENAVGGQKIRIILSAFTGDKNFSLVLKSFIRIVDQQTEKYYYDVKVPYDTAMLLAEDSEEHILIINTLNHSLNLLDLRQEHSANYYVSLTQAQEYLTKEFYEKYGHKSQPQVFCVGHTHIDVAWQWTLAVTRDKAVRSFSTVLELMRRYPEYKFMSSQPQLYQYVKEDCPEIYAEIKARIKEGRWEADGGMWVEADCNLASGESLIRQFLHGKKFFLDEFGVDNHILWLPDVFGYSATLPQIMNKCGIQYFMTTKISWNEFNQLPYDTFMWEGIDGTKILTHFSPSRDYNGSLTGNGEKPDYQNDYYTTYNAFLSPLQVKGAWQRYQQKHINKEVLMCFGYGDGGGGTTLTEIENQRRTALSIPGLPQTKMCTANEFFQTLENNVKDNKYLPSWVGELYLEYHRGTYTSMGRNKKYNRQSEFCYQNAERFSVMAARFSMENYPAIKLHAGWEGILLNQFHDILPGSSIKEVYDESKVQYEDILKTGNKIIDHALNCIAEHIDAPKDSVIVFNPNSHRVTDIVTIAGKTMMAYDVPANGYKVFAPNDMKAISPPPQATKTEMENQYFYIKLNQKGQFASIYDKHARRELLQDGKYGNVIMSYEDRPHNYDAWDVNNYYIEKCWEVDNIANIKVINPSDVSIGIKITRNYLNSVISQTIIIYSDIPRIDITNYIDWKEHQILLKSLFPLDIHTSEASYEIQYGNVKRPTHQNTSWDHARFEVCVHKWLDLAENGYGISFINDCKYGVSVQNNIVGLTMLKSGIFPNPAADQEVHEFTYSIFPHRSDFREAGTIAQAYQVNNKMIALHKPNNSGQLPASLSFVSVDKPNVIIEVIKKAETEEAIIIRLYESWGRRTHCQLQFYDITESIYECDMLENNEKALACGEKKVDFPITPFEIKTLKIKVKNPI